ncbi:hypothetical protein BJ684DRAFT_21359 [Piptocephalis cylindrospora]|uniref:Copper transport protein n=1 Tax=Piptocephalis cylindrospora TaxID=1907219 RepID=A0A4P9Y026_9FUNG|nr:hypothetical protein BJ684DRAFT_21359 [Piptocephalis cylindrospora]|eukprot:RKP12075.1 hypothetical protein BJ684DRAFT_21359 [Piptocephalis cylindrospora]
MESTPYFHHDIGSHMYFLSSAFPIHGPGSLFLAYFSTALLCWGERALTVILEGVHYSYPVPKSRIMLRSSLYALSIILRYLVMLLLMSFHLGFFIVIVLSTFLGQVAVEFYRARSIHPHHTATDGPFSSAFSSGGGPSYIKLQQSIMSHARNPPPAPSGDGDACS